MKKPYNKTSDERETYIQGIKDKQVSGMQYLEWITYIMKNFKFLTSRYLSLWSEMFRILQRFIHLIVLIYM